jgi:signal peptidase I
MILETVVLVVLAFAIAQGIKYFLIEPYLVPTESMVPAIEAGDRVFADKIYFKLNGKPKRGDIVVLDDPTGEFPQLIKRVIAIADDVIDLRDDGVYRNEVHLEEPYVYGKLTDVQSTSGEIVFPYTVPEGEVFIMGDNRTNSKDSRSFGSVPADSVNGRGFWTYWPLSRFGSLK